MNPRITELVIAALFFAAFCVPAFAGRDDEKIDKLIEQLYSKDQKESRKAMQELKRHGSGNEVLAHEYSRLALEHPDWAIRGQALEILRLAREEDYEGLFKHVLKNEKDALPLIMAFEGLARKGIVMNVEVLLKGLEHEHQYVQQRAANAMFYGIPEGAKEKLMDIVRTRKPAFLVSPAIMALGQNGVTEAEDIIIEFTKSAGATSMINQPCIVSLSKLGTKKAGEYLLERTKNLAEDKFASTVVNALGRLKDNKKAVDVLCKIASFSEDKNLRSSAIFALGETGSPAALDTLTKILKSDYKNRHKCIPAICKFEGDKANRALLQGASELEDNRSRIQAIEELVRRKDSRVIELCVNLLKKMQDSGYVHFTKACVEAIAVFKEKAAIPYVLDSLAITRNLAEHQAALNELRVFDKETLKAVYTEYINKPTKNIHLKKSIGEEMIKLEAPGLIELFGQQLLKEIDPGMRVNYARLLKKIADRKAVPILMKAFKKEDRCGCFDALMDALGACKDPTAVSAIIDMKGIHLHAHWQIHSVLALGEIGTKDAMKAVYETYENTKDPKIKGAAVAAISKSGDREHVAILMDLLGKKIDSASRERIINGFVRLEMKSIEPYLVECLDGKHGSSMPEKAMVALSKLSADPNKLLRSFLSNADKKKQGIAVKLLLEAGDKDSLPKIRKMLDSKDDEIAKTAAWQLLLNKDEGSADNLRKYVEKQPAGSGRYRLREFLMKLEKGMKQEKQPPGKDG